MLDQAGHADRAGSSRRTRHVAAPAATIVNAEDADPQEVLRLVETWAAGVEGPLRRSAFLRWWREADLAPGHPLLGLERTWRVFAVHFASWPAVLEAIGEDDRFGQQTPTGRLPHGSRAAIAAARGQTHARSAAAASGARARPAWMDAGQRRVVDDPVAFDAEEEQLYARARALEATLPHDATREELDDLGFQFLALAAGRYGTGMSYPDFDTWRAKVRGRADRENVAVPRILHSKTLKSRCGDSWPAARVRAGIPGAERLLGSGRGRPPYPTEVFIEAVATALTKFGLGLGRTQYMRLGKKLRKKADRRGKRLVWPNDDLVRQRLGGPDREWQTALAAVLAARPELAAELQGGGSGAARRAS